MSDPQEHFNVTTSTGNGAYDQICAFSQTLINQGFAELYGASPDLQKIYQLNTDVGKIDATFLPPQVIIPGANEGSKVFNVIFLLRFAEGKLYNKQNDIVIPSLKDFTLAYKVDLESAESSANGWKEDVAKYEKILQTEKDPAKLKSARVYLNATKKKLEYFVNTYDVPGDYSFQRLFLKLSSTKWSNYDDLSKYSQAGLRTDGITPYAMNEWLIDMDTGANASSPPGILADFLKAWGKKIEGQDMSCLGVSFQPPPIPELGSTLRSTSLTHQTSPYKVRDPVTQNYKGETGMTDIGGRNCLLYCEMVDDHLIPGAPIVSWTGNFATLPSSKGAIDQVDGSFLLGRKVFFENVIMKHLSRLNQATALFHQKVQPAILEGNETELTSRFPLSYGGHPDHPNVDDGFYKFETSNPKYLNDVETKYVWNKSQTWPDPRATGFESDGVTLNNKSGHAHCKQWFSDSMNSEVTWVPGKPELKVSGTTTLSDDAVYDQGLQPPNFADNNLTAFARFTVTIKWNLTMKIIDSYDEYKRSILTLTVDSGPQKNANVVITPDSKAKNMVAGLRSDTISAYVNKKMVSLVKEIVEDLEDAVKKAGQFIYPARGVLKFTNPAFTRHGDFLATVTHEPLKEGVRTAVPSAMVDKALGKADVKTATEAPTPVIKGLLLNWSIDYPEFFELKTGEVTFTAKNTSSEDLRFQSIIISVKAGTGDQTKNNLFAVDSFVSEASTRIKPPTTAPSTHSGTNPKVNPESTVSKDDPTAVLETDSTAALDGDSTTDPLPDATTQTEATDEQDPTSVAKQTSEQPPVKGEESAVSTSSGSLASDPTVSNKAKPPTKPKHPIKEGPGLIERIKKKIIGPPPAKPGTIKLVQNPATLPIKLVIRSPEEAAANVVASRDTHSREWQAVVQAEGSSFFTLKKDEWFAITFQGLAPAKSEQIVYIDEIWADAKGNTDDHRIEPRTISIINENDV